MPSTPNSSPLPFHVLWTSLNLPAHLCAYSEGLGTVSARLLVWNLVIIVDWLPPPIVLLA